MALTKVINSESKQYKPVLVDKLVLDAVPTVNSLNGVTSDAVARAIAGASGEVPQVTENDNGKVLTAVYDEGGAAVEWAEAQGGGASYTAGQGINIDANNQISVDTTVSTALGSLNVGGDSPLTMTFTPNSTATIGTSNIISTQQIEEVTISSGMSPWIVASYPSTLTQPLNLLEGNTATVVIPAPAEAINPYFNGVVAYYGKPDIVTSANGALCSQLKFKPNTTNLPPSDALAGGNFELFGANDPYYGDASYIYLAINSYDTGIKDALKAWMATWRVIEWPTEFSQTLAIPTPGRMLSVTNNELNVTFTAGITDIQKVNALPASPNMSVLYLIPEA